MSNWVQNAGVFRENIAVMNQIESIGDNPKLNERLWQAWVWKNRQLDKAAAAKRLRMLQVTLGIVVVAAVLQNLLR